MPTSGEALGAIEKALSSPPSPWSNDALLRYHRDLLYHISRNLSRPNF